MNIVLLPAPSYIGGVTTHVVMLAKGLSELGQHVFSIQGTPPAWFRLPFIRVPETIIGQVNLYFSRRYRRWSEDLYYAADTLWKTRGRIDVLNIQNVQHTGMAKMLQRLTGCKLVLTVHGYLTYEAEARKWCSVGDRTHQWLWTMEKSGYDRFDSIICVGSRAGSYVKQFTKKSINIIPNGLDTDFYQPGSTGLQRKEQKIILFAGALQFEKGIMDALQVIRQLVHESKRDVLLKIAGVGSQEAAARQFVADNYLTGNVEFLGSVDNNKMPDFYRAGDVLLFPSKQAGLSGKSEESSPYSVLEAMSSGVPVIAYRTMALQDQVQDGIAGYLVEPDDVNALVDRVNKLMLDAELLEKMGAAARTHCVQNFSHIKMAQNYSQIYGQKSH